MSEMGARGNRNRAAECEKARRVAKYEEARRVGEMAQARV